MPPHPGRHPAIRTPPRQIVAVAVALAAVGFALSQPDRTSPAALSPATSATPLTTWTGPPPSGMAGRLGDGTAYQPRIFITATDSVGLAPTPDGSAWRVLARTPTLLVELRRVPVASVPQFNGFAIDGDTVVWAESLVADGTDRATTIWRANWHTGTATLLTADTGNAAFSGGPDDLEVSGGRVTWTAAVAPADTEIRSVPTVGGTVTRSRLSGSFTLSTAPWAVSSAGGGAPIRLLNLNTGERITVATGAAEIGTCAPDWCRMVVVADSALARLDLQRPDGSHRQRVAGAEATPATSQVALLGRFVPLKIDQPDGHRPGLALYDIHTGRTTLVATGVDQVQGAGALLWWSTTDQAGLIWHALDLRGPP